MKGWISTTVLTSIITFSAISANASIIVGNREPVKLEPPVCEWVPKENWSIIVGNLTSIIVGNLVGINVKVADETPTNCSIIVGN